MSVKETSQVLFSESVVPEIKYELVSILKKSFKFSSFYCTLTAAIEIRNIKCPFNSCSCHIKICSMKLSQETGFVKYGCNNTTFTSVNNVSKTVISVFLFINFNKLECSFY